MARDRSLDEFLGGTSDGEAPASDGPGDDDSEGAVPEETAPDREPEDGPDADEEADAGSGPADVEPAAVEATMAVAPEGADCTACGATVERRWQGASGLVCADCKEW